MERKQPSLATVADLIAETRRMRTQGKIDLRLIQQMIKQIVSGKTQEQFRNLRIRITEIFRMFDQKVQAFVTCQLDEAQCHIECPVTRSSDSKAKEQDNKNGIVTTIDQADPVVVTLIRTYEVQGPRTKGTNSRRRGAAMTSSAKGFLPSMRDRETLPLLKAVFCSDRKDTDALLVYANGMLDIIGKPGVCRAVLMTSQVHTWFCEFVAGKTKNAPYIHPAFYFGPNSPVEQEMRR